ncbi:MAG: hypothetical protein EOO78_06190 [Oxalobacteraceae bacterium]|nr:MAG: hypothetical protein EOO78_06190 [Oxalobacteraceae bacterium]
MDKPSIPEDIRRFVLTSIPSVPFLEALLLMHADPARQWRKDTLAQRLYVREKTADGLLADLCAAGMAAPCPAPSDAYCYAPDGAALRTRIDRLADLYATHLVEVTLLIHSSLDRKAQQFANAFKWRKDS